MSSNSSSANDKNTIEIIGDASVEYTIYYDSDGTNPEEWSEIEQSIAILSSIEHEESPEEIVEKLKWKDRTFNKYKPIKVLNVRRDTKGKSGRW